MDLFVAGNVETILQGHVTSEILQAIPVKTMPYALGGAALPHPGPLEIGETVVYDGIGHIFTTKESWIETKTLQSAFLMGIERRPKEFFKTSKRQSIADFYEELMKNYPIGFAIVGKCHFSKLSVAYLQLSPIYEENINLLHDKYWQKESLANQEAELFGVVLQKPDPRAFYTNPNEESSSRLSSHTHVLAPFARHLLTDSELTSGIFWIEAIENINSI